MGKPGDRRDRTPNKPGLQATGAARTNNAFAKGYFAKGYNEGVASVLGGSMEGQKLPIEVKVFSDYQ